MRRVALNLCSASVFDCDQYTTRVGAIVWTRGMNNSPHVAIDYRVRLGCRVEVFTQRTNCRMCRARIKQECLPQGGQFQYQLVWQKLNSVPIKKPRMSAA